MNDTENTRLNIVDFIKYAKEQFGYDIILKPNDTPDTFKSIFGVSFVEGR